MPANHKIVPSSPNSISSSAEFSERNMEGIILSNFKLKPAGTGAMRNTLVERDSLSSYSWPDETNCQNGASRQAGEKASNGALQDPNENGRNTTTTNAPKRDTVLDIETDQDSMSLQEPTYVEAYMKFMYWTFPTFFLSPFDPERRWGSRTAGSRSIWILMIIQRGVIYYLLLPILFSTIIGFSFIKSFFQVKHFVLLYMTFPDLEKFVDMMFYVMNAGTKVYYVYLFVLQHKKFSQIFTSLGKLRAFRLVNCHFDSSSKIYSARSYAIRLGISSIVMSLVQTTLSCGVNEWTPQKGIQYNSYTTALALSVWSKDTMANDTLWDAIEDNYGSQLNTTNILLGAFGFLIKFCSCLHNEATGDLMQMQAETVREEMQCLEKKINMTGNDEHNITMSGFFRDNGEWAHSRLLAQAINDCNDTLDRIMKYKHVNNLMVHVFFVLNFFDGEYSLAFLAYLLYDICKSSYTYRIAAEASTLNESKMDWIRRLAWKSSENEFLKRVPLLLGETRAKPIGMGKGQFMVNVNFLYRFLGWVGSIFVLQAQSREAKAE